MGFTTTSKTLLEKIKQGDEVSWDEFYKTYAKLIWVCGDDFHFTKPDREDLIQMVMLEVFRMQRNFHYDRSKGRFRDYMRTIIRRQAIRLINKKRRNNGELIDEDLPDTAFDTFNRKWDDEWQSHLLEQAMEILQGRMEALTFQAFSYCIIDHLPPTEIAAKLGMKVDAVYVIKSRGIAMLKNTIRALEDSN